MTRRLRGVPDWGWAALAFALLAVVLLRDAVLGHGVLSNAGSLYEFTPFRGVAPRGWEAASNGLLFDAPSFYVPMAEMVRHSLRAGDIPLWNPLIMSGTPMLANQQSAPFALVNLPVWALPIPAGLAVSAGLKIWLAGLGTWLLGRRLGLGFWAALAAGVAYAGGGFTLSWLEHALTNVSVLLPWVLLTTELVCARPRPAAFLLHALATGLFLLGGHPETALFTGLAITAYFLTRVWAAGDRGAELRTKAGAFAGATALGMGLAAIVTLPFLADLAGSVDRQARSAVSLAPRESFLTLFFPDWWGRPSEGSVLGPGNFNERTFYAGALMVLFVPLALWRASARRRLAPVVTLGVIGLLASTSATWTSGVVGELPVLGLSALGRLGMLVTLAVALLGGAGIDAIARERRLGPGLGFVAGGLALGLVALLLALPVGGGAWWRGVREVLGLSQFSPAHPLTDPTAAASRSALDALHLAAVYRWWLLVAAAGLVLVAARRSLLPAALLAPALAAVVVVDMVTFDDGYHPVIPRSHYYRPVPQSVRLLQDRLGHERFAAVLDSFPSNVNEHFGLADVRGLDHPRAVRLVAFWRALLNHDQAALDPLKLQNPTPQAAAILSMMGVRYLMTDVRDPRPPPTFRRVYRGRSEVVWRNTDALPRAYVARSVQWLDTPAHALTSLATPGFDAHRSTVVEHDPEPLGTARGSVRFLRDDPEDVKLEADLDRPGLVVLSDSWSEGWRARVDGRPATALRANYLYRAVRVPAGRHTITWHYRPAAYTAGVVISTLSALALLALAGVLAVRAYRRPRVVRAAAVPG